MNAVVAIGRNVDGIPMSDKQWEWFVSTVTRACNRAGILISRVLGSSYSDQWGPEEAAWFVLTLETDREEFVARLDAIRHAYKQDAIAVTFGETELVGL